MKAVQIFRKIAVLLFSILCCLVKQTYAQQLDPIYYFHDTVRSNLFFGSAKSLKGKTLVINCFISSGRRKWKAAEKNEILRMQKEGFDWVQKEASYWTPNRLEFTVTNLGFETDIQLDKIESDREPQNLHVKWVPMVFQKLGYEDLTTFYDSVKNTYRTDNVAVMIFAKHTGRSYAQTSYGFRSEFLEGAIVYDEDFNSNPVQSATIIHEMLHLFGARDIYKSSTQNKEAVKLMNSVFPSSIMLQTHRDLGPLKIEQFTAWCVGWTHSYWGWYQFFLPVVKQ
jgi:hypothetical protein